MHHKKIEHSEKVATCWNFSTGKCDYADEECWFNHSSTQKHRKKEHKDLVVPCRNMLKGTCKFGKSKCWFNHDNLENSNESEENENSNKENNDVIQKIFEMMETMTERIVQMEESNLEKAQNKANKMDMKIKIEQIQILEGLQYKYEVNLNINQRIQIFTLSRGPAYRLPMPLFYFSVQVIETSI